MADHDNFVVLPHYESQVQNLIGSVLQSDIVVHDFRGGKVRFKALTEGTISLQNTGATTDTVIGADDASLFSFARSTLFNATVQNENKEEQALVGYIVMVDHTKTSPDTDSGNTRIHINFRVRSGGSPTYAQAGYGKKEIILDSFKVVEAAAQLTMPYAGPFLIPLHFPIICKRNESVLEYLASSTTIYRTTANYPTFNAHTVVTTYTIKVAAYAVLVDTEVLGQYKSLDQFWNEFLIGGA